MKDQKKSLDDAIEAFKRYKSKKKAEIERRPKPKEGERAEAK